MDKFSCIAMSRTLIMDLGIHPQIGFYLEDGRLTVKVCEAVNINYTDGAPCFVSLTSA